MEQVNGGLENDGYIPDDVAESDMPDNTHSTPSDDGRAGAADGTEVKGDNPNNEIDEGPLVQADSISSQLSLKIDLAEPIAGDLPVVEETSQLPLPQIDFVPTDDDLYTKTKDLACDVPIMTGSVTSIEQYISVEDGVALNNYANKTADDLKKVNVEESGAYKTHKFKKNEVRPMSPQFSKSRAVRPVSRYHHNSKVLMKNTRKPSITTTRMEIIPSLFKRLECIHFVEDKDAFGDFQRCNCGGSLEEHWHGDYQHKFRKATSESEQWNAVSDIISTCTNTYGKINFTNLGLEGRSNAKFVRVSNDCSMDDILWKLLIGIWGMNETREAHLVISITGGGRNFEMDPRVTEKFETGLVKAAKSTNAWILTAGFHMGIVKAVGGAISKGQTFYWGPNRGTTSLQCVGILPWGYIDDRYKLTPDGDEENEWDHDEPVDYYVNKVVSGKDIALDPNHTHFIMVDDGTRGNYKHLSEFRADLERKIMLPANPTTDRQECGLGTPIVMVIVEGGPDALIDCATSMKNGVPVVVCSNSGRAADILAEAYDRFLAMDHLDSGERDQFLQQIEQEMCKKMISAFSNKRTWRTGNVDEKAKKYFGYLQQCCKDRHMITVFDLKNDEHFDKAILKALFKGKGQSHEEQKEAERLSELRLALLWDRSDVAQEEIFSQNIQWSIGSLDDIFTQALIEGKNDFVQLLMKNGVALREFLTVEKLTHLYNMLKRDDHAFSLLRRHIFMGQVDKDNISLEDVSKLLKRFIGKHNEPTYLNVKNLPPETKFDKPYRELLFWALFQNRHDMALMFWENGEENLKLAITATLICTQLAKTTRTYKTDLKLQYLETKKKFEDLATEILVECEHTDPELTSRVLQQPQMKWGGVDYLKIAAEANSYKILSTTACQRTVNDIWRGDIVSPKEWTYFCIFLPFFALCLIKFKENLNPFRKLVVLYRTPNVKFLVWLVFFLGFLGLYTYLVLFRLKKDYFTVEEVIVMVWLLTMVVDELREMFISDSGTGTTRFKNWWGGTSNKLDFLIYIVAIVTFCLRSSTDTTVFLWARQFYCINCVLLYCRLLSFYSANSKVGPRLVVIKRVLFELVVFMSIMLVFVMAYGVTVQALLYPTMTPHVGILKEIFYYPYWQIYGEIFLDELDTTGQVCNADGFVTGTSKFCRADSWLAYVLLALYLLIGNVLLLNLLIAIYNNVFQEVEDHALDVWKFDRYSLVKEYQEKPALPPPFVFFEDIVIFIQFIIKKCKKLRSNRGKKLLAEEEVDEELELFEKVISSNYASNMKLLRLETLDERVKYIKKQLEVVAKRGDTVYGAENQTMQQFTSGITNSATMQRDKQNTEAIQKLQQQNSAIQDKLDKILSDLAKK